MEIVFGIFIILLLISVCMLAADTRIELAIFIMIMSSLCLGVLSVYVIIENKLRDESALAETEMGCKQKPMNDGASGDTPVSKKPLCN